MLRGMSLAARRIDPLLGAMLALWMGLLVFDPAPPLGLGWWTLLDLPGLLIAGALLLRRSVMFSARTAFQIVPVLLLWLLWRTPDLLANTQAGHAVLAATVLLGAMVAPRSTARHLQCGVLFSGIAAVALTLVCERLGWGQWLSAHWSESLHPSGGWRRWAGPTAHPNLLAYLCTLTLWAAIAWPWRGDRWERVAMAMLGAALGFTTFATLGRVGWFLFLTTAFFGAVWVWRAHRKAILPALPALLLVAAALASFAGASLARPDLVTGRAATVYRQFSPTPAEHLANPEANIISRGNVYRDAAALIRESPMLGRGLAAYERLGRYATLHTHALLLELLIIGGVPALVLALGGLLWALLRGHEAFARGAILIALLAGVADYFFFFKWPMIWLAFAVGVALHRPTYLPASLRFNGTPAVLHSATRALRGQIFRYRYVLLIFAGLAVAYQMREASSFDFHAYYGATRWHAETGESPYQAWTGSVYSKDDSPLAHYLRERQTDRMPEALRFLYPPTALLQLRAFTWPDDPVTAARLWRMFNLGLIGVAIALLVARLPERSRAEAATLACLFIGSYEPVRDTLWLGQMSLWVSLLMAVFIWGLGARRPVIAGASLAIAVALKVYPILWLLLVLMYPGRRVKTLLSFSACAAVLFALSIAMDGTAIWQAYWVDVLSRVGDVPPGGGTSLYPFIGSHATHASDGLKWLNRAMLLGLLAVCAVCAWTSRNTSAVRKERVAVAISAALFLTMPLAWLHYLVLIVLLLSGMLVRGGRSAALRLPLGVGTAILVYLLTGQMWIVEVVTGYGTVGYARLGLVAAILLPLAYRVAQRNTRPFR